MIVSVLSFMGLLVAALGVGLVRGLAPKGSVVGHGWGTRVSRRAYSDRAMAEFMSLWLETWLAVMGTRPSDVLKLTKALDGLYLEWVDAPFDVRGYLATGSTDSRDRVRLSVMGSLRRTALSHELCHVVLWALRGDPDADHLGGRYLGWDSRCELVIDRMRVAHREVDDTLLV